MVTLIFLPLGGGDCVDVDVDAAGGDAGEVVAIAAFSSFFCTFVVV